MNYGPRRSLELAEEAIRLHASGLTWNTIYAHLRVGESWTKYWIKKLEKKKSKA